MEFDRGIPLHTAPPFRRLVLAIGLAATLAVTAACGPDAPSGPVEDAQDLEDAQGEPDTDTPDPDVPDPNARPAPDELEVSEELQEVVAEVQSELPSGWQATVVHDEQSGPYVLGVPAGAVTWQVGDHLGPVAEAAAGTNWSDFWIPRLEPLDPGTSNIRAVVVDADDEPRSIQVNVTPYDLDIPPDDAAAIGEAFTTVFQAQGFAVHDAAVVSWTDTEVAEVRVSIPADVLPPGRDVRQRFYPQAQEGALWSVQCDGPAATEDPTDGRFDPALDDTCDAVLDAFRPPV